jgi:four helix bundle protein
MQDYRKLSIWQRSRNISIEIYKVTSTFPKEEIYGLTSQIRRCAVSIPANIAEGCGRSTSKDFASFINIAVGSLNELQTLLEISIELNYLNSSDFKIQEELEEIKAMLLTFLRKLRH